MKLLILPKILFLFFVFSAQAKTSQVELRLKEWNQSRPKVSGKFKQTRLLKKSDVKLTSSGTFRVSQDESFSWLQEEPFVSEISMKDGKLSLRQGGQNSKNIQMDPVASSIARIFLGLFKGDSKKVGEMFHWTEVINSKNWIVDLEPKDSLTAKALKKIVVTGRDFIQSIEVIHANGDLLKIHIKLDDAAK